VRRKSGEVNTSSVGRFGTCLVPQAVSKRALIHFERSLRPMVRSVPGPV